MTQIEVFIVCTKMWFALDMFPINFTLTYHKNVPTLILSPTFTLPELVLPLQDPGRARGIRPRQEHRAGRGVALPVPGDRAPAAVHTEREQLRHRRLPER